MGTRSGQLGSSRSVKKMVRKGVWEKGRYSFEVFLLLAFLAVISSAQNLDNLALTLRSGSSEQKRDALFQIRNLQTEQASRLAIPALKDADEMVRATAASSVVYLPKREAARILMPIFADKSEFVRKEAVYAIGEVGDDIAMLGEHNYGDIADALWKALEKEKSMEVRSAIVMAMGKAGGLKSVQRLLWYLNKPESRSEEFLRRSAVRSIGYVAETLRSRERRMHYLERGMTDEDFQTIDYSEEFTHFSAAADMFIGFLEDPKEASDVKREAAAAIGHLGSSRAKSALTAALNSADPYLVENSKKALEKIERLKSQNN